MRRFFRLIMKIPMPFIEFRHELDQAISRATTQYAWPQRGRRRRLSWRHHPSILRKSASVELGTFGASGRIATLGDCHIELYGGRTSDRAYGRVCNRSCRKLPGAWFYDCRLAD